MYRARTEVAPLWNYELLNAICLRVGGTHDR